MLIVTVIVSLIVLGFWINAAAKFFAMKKARKEYLEIERQQNRLN